jgi:translation initiation factor IF-3
MVHDNGVLEGPLRTQFVLTRVEPHESLRMVSPYVPATKEQPQKFAVCRIVDKKAEFEKAKLAKTKEQEKKQRVAKDKELEVNWGIGPNDLQTKIGTVARLMEGPVKVTVKFGRKKGSKASLEYADMEELVKKVREQIAEMGGREHRPAEGSIGKTMMLHFASKHA